MEDPWRREHAAAVGAGREAAGAGGRPPVAAPFERFLRGTRGEVAAAGSDGAASAAGAARVAAGVGGAVAWAGGAAAAVVPPCPARARACVWVGRVA
jgi:hypothetical protein